MKQACLIVLLLLWTVLVALGATRWAHRGQGRPSDSIATQAKPVDVAVRDWVRLDGEQWMLSFWRMSRGSDVHVKREPLPEGGARIVVDDSNGFSWDTVTIDFSKTAASLKASARMDQTRDFGPPFGGSALNLTGYVNLNSSDVAGAHPLIIDFMLRGEGEGGPICEHGRVSVP